MTVLPTPGSRRIAAVRVECGRDRTGGEGLRAGPGLAARLGTPRAIAIPAVASAVPGAA
ncbi:hypothetical protein NFI95_09065 [Acetobacteraceae bacterium KSS8]|uniref:Uncharacterized protein n=1 Tax=Endosaccharibacter trunci TaxID=2812733 RepID=A0ABT1W6V5_9PROT|nr:hypothetical protein [Acetobacteraceae bacterium KSS8]